MKQVKFLNRNLLVKKGVFNNQELIVYGSGGGTIVPSEIVYVDATFHRYGPAGPVTISDDDILDDTGTQAAEIDKGQINYLSQEGAVDSVIENEEVTQSVKSVGGTYLDCLFSDNGIAAGRTFGLTNRFKVQTAAGNNENFNGGFYKGANITASVLKPSYVYGSNCRVDGKGHVIIPWTVDGAQVLEHSVTMGGYNGSFEPDPLGESGFVFYRNGSPIYGEPENNPGRLADRTRHTQSSNSVFLQEQRVYVDPSLLATPARSLFATDHADIADYVPEDGPGFSVPLGSVATSGGSAVAGAGPSHCVRAEYGQGYFEYNVAVGVCGCAFRYADNQNFWCTSITATTGAGALYEVIGGTPTDRGAIAGSGAGRKVTTDSNELDMTVISPENGNVLTASSTAGAANKTSGLFFEVISSAISWECIR